MTDEKKFMSYDYKEVEAERNMIPFLRDGYENFGWETEEKVPEGKTHPNQNHKSILQMRRNRKIMNKPELQRLQSHFEACVKDVKALEKSKESKATMVSLIVGILGTAFMAGSVFAVTAEEPFIVLCIILAIPGFIGWIVPYFLYKRILEKQTQLINPLIEKKYDEIYEICEKGSRLLNIKSGFSKT